MSISIRGLQLKRSCSFSFLNYALTRCYHGIPFLDLYENTTGHPLSEYMHTKLKKNYPALDTLSHDRLQYSLQILKKFGINSSEACDNPHVFCMNPISLDNYGEILKECGFINIVPKHLVRYRTLVQSHTIAHHKKEGLIRDDIELEEVLQSCFHEWPSLHKIRHHFPDSNTSILAVRLSVLEGYLTWKLSITPDEFKKYCRNYLPLKHKPMHDIQEALDIAGNNIKFDINSIRRNGFVISADPVNTKMILENVETLAGLDIREAIRIEPAILKNNYNSLLQIRDILEEYRIPQLAQRRCLKVFCMCPKSVRERLEDLKNLKEYNILSTNPRVLSMVIHQRKMMTRLSKIQAARKQCYSLNHLVSSSKVFNEYISSFGNKVCGRDIAVLITSSLDVREDAVQFVSPDTLKFVLTQLRRHKFWLHAALNVVDENIKFLKRRFKNDIILKNCQLLLYPVLDIEQYIEYLLNLRENRVAEGIIKLDYYNNLSCEKLTDEQVLSLALYEIEKKYHFSGDGIWARQDGVKIETQSINS
ncbi:transcription termination factor 5, mitochondrial-like [Choristoneura fumiferana]|uniref:transcription termination factor 5, mitochondrial-like n=1 Tax=Choristoneura fumiferana TaxID=7141 RepID=UPI003D15852D